MIRIWNTIRTRWDEYLLEMVVVFISIFAAFGLNNWREGRQEKEKEMKVLKEVAANIEMNCDRLGKERYVLQKNNEAADTILFAIQHNRAYDESMDTYFHQARNGPLFHLPTSGYEQLKNTGFDLIKSDTVKTAIIQLFENTYSDLDVVITKARLTSDDFGEYLKHHFLTLEGARLKPVNYEYLLSDHYYKSSLMYAKGARSWQITRIDSSLDESAKVFELINQFYPDL